MAAKGSSPVVVLAVHVFGYRAADGHKLRAWCGGQKPATRYGELQYVRQRHAGFAAQQSALFVKGDEAIEQNHIQQRATVIQAAISVTAAQAIWQHQPFNGGQISDLVAPADRDNVLRFEFGVTSPGLVSAFCHQRTLSSM